jgi:formylglycine-generating enzyme required for sulfatase activity
MGEGRAWDRWTPVPWGEEWDESRVGEWKNDRTHVVGSVPRGAGPYDVHDMAGNVLEWVADWFDQSYYERSPERNPAGPASGQYKVLRGGSWLYNPFNLRTALRYDDSPDGRGSNVGFRCARGSEREGCQELLSPGSWLLISDGLRAA